MGAGTKNDYETPPAAYMAEAFRQLGHEAEFCYLPVSSREKNMLLYKFFIRTPFYWRALKYLEKHLERQSSLYFKKIESYKPDMIFFASFGDITGQQVKRIKEKYGIPVVFWALGGDEAYVSRFTPFNLDMFTHASHIFIADRSWFSTFKLLGEAKLSYLTFGVDPALYKPLSLKKEFDIGIAAGNMKNDVPTVIQKGFILSRLCKEGFQVRASIRNVERLFSILPELKKLDVINEVLPVPEVNILYNKSKISLALNNPQQKSAPHMRVFEIAAGNNFQLAEYREEMASLFGDTVISFRSLDELAELTRFYLKHDQEREKLAQKSYELVLREHTSLHRAKKVLEEVFGCT